MTPFQSKRELTLTCDEADMLAYGTFTRHIWRAVFQSNGKREEFVFSYQAFPSQEWTRWIGKRFPEIVPDAPASTLEAVRTLETAADSLMRLGDPQNAIALYALALRIRSENGFREESYEHSTRG